MAKKTKKTKKLNSARIDQVINGSLKYCMHRMTYTTISKYDAIEFHGELCYELGTRLFSAFDSEGKVSKKMFRSILSRMSVNNPSMISLTKREVKELWTECLLSN